MPESKAYLYNNTIFRNTVQDSLRPGGLELTEQILQKGFWQTGFWTDKMLVADLGCGIGSSLALLNKYKIQTVGIDSSFKFIHEAQQSLQTNNFGKKTPDFLCSDINSLPLKNNVLDGIICECVLSLQKTTEQTIAECYRVLKTQGLLYLSDVTLIDVTHLYNKPANNFCSCENKFNTYYAKNEQHHSQSCLSAAKDITALNEIFLAQGFSILYFKNHPNILKQLAAQLIWNGASKKDLIQWLGLSTSTSCKEDTSLHLKNYSYTQWILKKEKQ